MSYSFSPRPILAPRGATSSTALEGIDVPHERPKVLAVMDCGMRNRVEAAIVHAGGSVCADATPAAGSVRAILVSAKARQHEVRAVGRLVMECAGVRAVAIQDDSDPPSANELLYLGACGVTELVNLSQAEGWRRLRTILADAGNELPTKIFGFIDPLITDASDETRRFFRLLVLIAPRVSTVRELGQELDINPSTLTSRFFRAKLPLPRCYLAAMRILYVRALLEAPAASITDVAYELRYSSPQSLGRHIRQNLGLSATEFRRKRSVAEILALYLTNLIVPYRETLKRFNPLRSYEPIDGAVGSTHRSR